jgi:TPR repeat protein
MILKYVLIGLFLFISVPSAVQAGYEEGYQAANKGAYATAFKEFKSAAERGDPRAQYSLAVMFNDGIGVRKDPAEARVWFRKAADNGHPMAIEILKRTNK